MEIAGVQVFDRTAVAALAMGERADDGELVGDLRVQRQRFAEVEAGDVRLDRLIRPAILRRRIGFGIVGLELRRPAVHPEQNHGGVGGGAGFLAGCRAQAQQIRQRQASQAEGADLQERAARHAFTRSRCPAEQVQHGFSPSTTFAFFVVSYFRVFVMCAVQRRWFPVGANPTRQLGHSSR